MSFGTQLSIANIPAVHAKPDVGPANPDGQGKREGKERQPRRDNETPHPVPNAQGQITGKLIDITA